MKPQFKIVFLMLAFVSKIVFPQTIKVTAEYKPASYETSGGRFVSTTPCVKTASGMWLSYCRGEITSLDSLLFSTSYGGTRTAKKRVENPKDSIVYMQSFSQKEMIVASAKGISYRVSLTPQMLGAHFDATIYHETAKPIYYDGFTNPKGGCSYLDKQVAGHTDWLAWMVLWGEVAGKTCYTALSADVGVTVKTLFFGFKITPPSPLEMPNGVYNGSIALSVSSNGDISLGNGTYNDTQLIIDLTLTVRHQLKVDFPKNISEGKSNVVLLPPNGWNDWCSGSKKVPAFLQHKLPFRISYSAPYTVTLKCQYTSGQSCALKDAKNHEVAINTIYIDSRDQMTPLMTTPIRKYGLYERGPVVDKEEYILFKTPDESFKQMMKYPGSSFKGDVTLIFDAAID
ncbi:hypothetical protein JD501_17005 [Aeromonas hydrophila]|uniref:hypothetical protein n=1 Tax=Aeromonas hydrophila TaxID=644 RepID=UPI00191CE9E9|nr:hypothetical protein [Aeromonas hydrophila]MBL0434954.1 hypothetical protein [Aeromonas hydrophila]MBL0470871.1 hypothetical protein [Aeromonas hydrophila]